MVDPQALKQVLRYSTNDMTSAYMEQAGHLADYGVLLANATRQHNQVKLLLEVEEGKIDKIIREEAAGAGEKISEAQIEKRLNRHPNIIRIKRAMIEARHVEDLAKTALKALDQKRDMLIQQGATERKEMDGEVRISARNAREQLQEDQKARILAQMQPQPISE